MIEHLSLFPADVGAASSDVGAFAFHGQVMKAGFDSVFLPVVAEELKNHQKLRLYYETAPNFMGFNVGAMWDDFAVGMEHITRWDRVAVVTSVERIERATQLFGTIFPSRVKLFPNSEIATARAWISAR